MELNKHWLYHLSRCFSLNQVYARMCPLNDDVGVIQQGDKLLYGEPPDERALPQVPRRVRDHRGHVALPSSHPPQDSLGSFYAHERTAVLAWRYLAKRTIVPVGHATMSA